MIWGFDSKCIQATGHLQLIWNGTGQLSRLEQKNLQLCQLAAVQTTPETRVHKYIIVIKGSKTA
jgi:hypothetical protein